MVEAAVIEGGSLAEAVRERVGMTRWWVPTQRVLSSGYGAGVRAGVLHGQTVDDY
jgi:hypothetical protein